MTHEQKPESAEFRTRAEQIVMIMCEARYSDIIREKGLEELFDTILAEAEARGAAEQRRKDAEGIITYEEALRRKCADDVTPAFMGSMMKISKLISWLQDVHSNYGDTCVYARSLSWGAVALNKESDDRKALSAEKHAAWTDVSPLDGDPVANVAAHEARVKELEGAIEQYFEARYACEAGCISRTRTPEHTEKERAREFLLAAIREGGEHG